MSDDAFIEATRNAPAETEPGQTVNDLYAQWKNAPEDARVSILRKMDPLLTQYAERVVWMQLHLTDSFLVREMVDALERDLHSFEGRSKFFVWVHSRLKLRCIDEWRYRRKIREGRVEPQGVLFREEHDPVFDGAAMDDDIHLDQMLSGLDLRDREILEARVRGESDSSEGSFA
jgi:hypothetical protein